MNALFRRSVVCSGILLVLICEGRRRAEPFDPQKFILPAIPILLRVQRVSGMNTYVSWCVCVCMCVCVCVRACVCRMRCFVC